MPDFNFLIIDASFSHFGRRDILYNQLYCDVPVSIIGVTVPLSFDVYHKIARPGFMYPFPYIATTVFRHDQKATL